jgi:hypothetical protein
MKVIDAVKIWWGLQVVDNYIGQYQPVYYSDNPETARRCFTTTDESGCRDDPECIWRPALKKCVPKSQSKWVNPHESVINDGYSYNLFRLTENITFLPKSTNPRALPMVIVDRDIRILQYSSTTVIHFPTGMVIDISLENEIINNIVLKIKNFLDENETVVLCGHSMGCVVAQMVGLQLITLFPNVDINNLYIVGSAPYQWATRHQVNTFLKAFYEKSMFFGICNRDNQCDMFLYERASPQRTTFFFPLIIVSENLSGEKVMDLHDNKKFHNSKMVSMHNWSIYRPLIKSFIDSQHSNAFGMRNHQLKKMMKYLNTFI